MRIEEAKALYRGPMIAVITNLNADLSIDHGAIRENLAFIIDHGFRRGNGAFLGVGAGGDFPMLTVAERKAAAKTIVDAVAGRVPVLIGAQDTNIDTVIEMARWAEEIGAEGIQMSAGYYYASSDEDCLRLFDAVHKATRTIQIMVYNTPWEGYNMSLDQLRRLAQFPRCVSLKWSTSQGSAEYLRGVAQFADKFAIVDNEGMFVMTHLLGGTGFITHLATVWPEHDLGVWQLMEDGDYAAAQAKITAANWPWQDFRGKMWKRTGCESPVIKAALELCGRPGGPTRLPARSLQDEERSELRDILKWIGVPYVR
ncbi:MAG: dihydrodipicolinate synthase family protein [Planctomycetes bacterium]|nr:dihydrodipicolinate synthase family protein [Planctomycetota bacterium]